MPPRPEFENPPEIFYNAREARKYNVSTRNQKIQRDMTMRALELINLPRETDVAGIPGVDGGDAGEQPTMSNRSVLLLDIGCGSGISGDVLTERGHAWMGVDISLDMLRIAKSAEICTYSLGGTHRDEGEGEDEDREPAAKRKRADPGYVRFGPIHDSDEDRGSEASDEGTAGLGAVGESVIPEGPRMIEVAHSDIGQGLPFRPGSFDGCVSISVIQWLCHSSKKGEVPQRRLMCLFQSLYNALRRGAKAVMQFYPSSPDQVDMITRAAMRCGFSGGVVVDYPHSTKAKKYYLVLQAGQVAGGFVPPPGLTDEQEEDSGYEEGEEDDEEEMGDSEEDEVNAGRSRIRVAGRDRERLKRGRAASSRETSRHKGSRPTTGSKDWVLMKKAERRRRGFNATSDTKYTMRKRKPRF